MCVDLGCRQNALDGALIWRHLQRNDWRRADRAEDADLIIVNSCGVTQSLARESLAVYERMVRVKRADALGQPAEGLPVAAPVAAGSRPVPAGPEEGARWHAAVGDTTPGDRS